MALKLHYNSTSASCRATLLTIRALDIDVDVVKVDLAAHDHLTNAFIEMNPFHTIPTLQNGTVTLWDSHTINMYLVDKYAPDDSLYPKDLFKRAIVNQRLHFDSGVLEARLRAIVESILKGGARTVAKDKADALIQGLTLLEGVLEKSKYVAGDTLTIADFSIIATVTNAKIIVPLAANRFPKITEWLARMQELPYYDEVSYDGIELFTQLMKNRNVIR